MKVKVPPGPAPPKLEKNQANPASGEAAGPSSQGDIHTQWPRSLNVFRGDFYHQGPRPLDLYRTVHSEEGDRFSVSVPGFERARQALLAWARVAGFTPLPGPAELPSLAAMLSQRRILADTEEGQLALDALQATGMLGACNRDLVDALVKQLGTSSLEGVHVVYNGHATQEKIALKPTLEALGVSSLSTAFMPNSGSNTMESLFRGQLVHHGGVERREPGLDHRADVAAQELRGLNLIKQAADDAERRGEVAVVDKGGIVAKYLDADLKRQIENGTLRFIAHNTDDVQALQGLSDSAIIIDLAGSDLKALEAEVIGEQSVLMAAREARLRWQGARLPQMPLYILGFGLLGGQIGSAMLRLGLEPANICVVDPSEQARARATALGFRTLAEPPDGSARPPRALVFPASTGPTVTGSTVDAFAKDVIFMPITSAGKAVDVESLRPRIRVLEQIPRGRGPDDQPPADVGGASAESMRDFYCDWEIETEPDAKGRTTRVLIPVEGFPLNLYQESWAERFGGTTVAGVVLAIAEAKRQTKPGVHRIGSDLQTTGLEVHRAHRLAATRPLDLVSRSPTEEEDLAEDFASLRRRV